MTNNLADQALEEIRPRIVLYMSELGYLLKAPAEHKETFELTAQKRLEALRGALKEVRARYEVTLPDSQVITYGLQELIAQFRLQTAQTPPSDGFTQTLETTIKTFLQENTLSLTGLLNFARTYEAAT